MTSADLSVVMTAHDETVVSGPTMASAEAAVAAAERAGLTVERVVALDCPTPACHAYFHQPDFAAWRKEVVDLGDVGATRNRMAETVGGEFLAFLDSDDLFSENWLADGCARLREAADRGERAIAHPELNWLFDAAASVFVKPEQTDPLFSPYYFYGSNYYDSLCLAPRAAHLDVPYVRRALDEGFSFQDWQFNIESMARGWRHVVVRDTIIFKRRRDASLVTESVGRKAIVRSLEPMAIDAVADLAKVPAPSGPE